MRFQILSSTGVCIGATDDFVQAMDRAEEMNTSSWGADGSFFQVFDTETTAIH